MHNEETTIPYLDDTVPLCTQPHVMGKSTHATLSPHHEPEEETSPPETADELLGKGGMGIVFRQKQELPKRFVAVKKLIRDSSGLRTALLREADIMGRLEHPNIPPIHGVAKQPTEVVMKLIDGKNFSEILQQEPQRGEALRQALDVLIQVSYALEYAHEQKIIHRDIKPENIMVGRFNEVYLMDWGLAIHLDDRHLLPSGLAGTPVYMAPEMVCENPMMWGFHTDIYLVGALLHEILTGAPRHLGTTLSDVLIRASQSLPYTYEEDVPQELAQIANHCCAREIAERYSSIAEVREAIFVYRDHSEALSLALAAESKRKELLNALIGFDESANLDAKLYTLAAQARFGFEQALHSWEDCRVAKDGLQSILSLMIERAIRVGDVERARLMLKELPTYDERLGTLCAEKEKSIALESTKKKELESFVENLNPKVSFDARFWLQAAMSISLFVNIFLFRGLDFHFWGTTEQEKKFHVILMIFLPSWILIIANYRLFMKNAFGRQALRTVGLGTIGFCLERYLSYIGRIDIETAHTFDIIILSLALINAAPAIRMGPRLSILGLVVATISIFLPLYSELLMYFVAFTIALVISWDWHSEDKERKRKKTIYS